MCEDRKSNDPNQGHAFADTHAGRGIKERKEDEHHQEKKTQVQAQLYPENSS
jgi:hypothetical protein